LWGGWHERPPFTFDSGSLRHRVRRFRGASGLRREGWMGLVPRNGLVDNREQLREQEMTPPIWPFPTWQGKPFTPQPKPVQPYPGEALI